ncbi:carbohydrate ABC transporter permease [Paenibacillus harenae]|uniref:Aldouronate transport system permease protein n=1 Tax=Paenibacillus harenae TaxID=306543 RepID=A0ABT9U6B5_PAEHA|nr:carbohydrate ABC transporter permease [Paenibacillus harenae]MDQ0115176.1 putative aldouronate transport system permease protein [Paenibacillus harenae]
MVTSGKALKKPPHRGGFSSKAFHWVNYLVLALCAYATLFPFVNIIAVSFSSSRAINAAEVFMWPIEFNMNAYVNLLKDGQLLVAMKNTALITLVGTALNMLFTIMAAYPLSKSRLRGRNFMLMAILFTMLFSGGLIPNFLLINSLGLVNTYWALWLPALISAYNMFVMKSFLEGLPDELEESAQIDGAGDAKILWKIVLPLSKPVIAALTLFYAVGWWNSYMNVLIYIRNTDKLSLMVKLHQMIELVSPDMLRSGEGLMQTVITPEGIRAAAVVIAITPILCVYPFLQKHFIKGVLLGSVKG